MSILYFNRASNKYVGFNFTHFLEKLVENENITISYGSLYRILTEAGFKSPKKQRTKKKSDIHPIRPRKENFGEMLQIDASLHHWFGSGYQKATLHGAIDDSTGTVMGLYFDEEETLKGYYNNAQTDSSIKPFFKKSSEDTWKIVARLSPIVLGLITYLVIAIIQKTAVVTGIVHGLGIGLISSGCYASILTFIKEEIKAIKQKGIEELNNINEKGKKILEDNK